MSTLPANPKVEAIRESVRNSNATLHQLIDGPLSRIEQVSSTNPLLKMSGQSYRIWRMSWSLCHIGQERLKK